jgi:hypothetical protein
MKPSQLAAKLRQIATTIDNSKQPDRAFVARDLKRVLAGMDSGSGSLIVHIHGDGEMIDVVQSSSMASTKPFDSLTLPKGDILIIAKSLDDIKSNMDMSNEALLDALFNRGLIETDDDGNYIGPTELGVPTKR